MSDGNKRYLGDVFINSENYERQAQFFKDIIESYQWKYNGDFDAATLQGKSASDFATVEQGNKSDKALLTPLLIGKKSLANVDEPQYIFTDATLLDKEHEHLAQIPWFRNISDDSLSEALYIIYQNIENKVKNEEYEPIKDAIEEICEEVRDIDGNTRTKVNASLVNGLRFILITQENYDNLPSNVKNYWRNVFIIRDQIPSDYYDPLSWDLTDGYQFEINDDKLQVQSVMTGEYHDICTLNEMLEGMDFDAKIRNYITNENKEYIIPSNNMANSIQRISPNTINEDWEQYPFLSSSLHDDFVENITINGSTDNIDVDIDDATKFKTIDLDLDSIIANPLNDISQSMTETSNRLYQLQSDIDSNATDISALQGRVTNTEERNTSQDSDIYSINTQLSTMNKNITNLSNQITKLRSDIVSGWIKSSISSGAGYCWYNPVMSLGVLYYATNCYWNGSTSWGRRFKNTSTQVTDRVAAKPFSTINALTNDENIILRITPENGDITLRITGGPKGVSRPIQCTAIYKYVS